MKRERFGIMPDGTSVEQYTLQNAQISCKIITYGGAVRSLTVPSQTGKPIDVVLGFDTLEAYQKQDKYIGALIGRYANRIGGSQFVLNGKTYCLCANDGENHLHGGPMGFDKQVWTVESATDDMLKLSLISPDGQEGYPGNLQVEVIYRLDGHSLVIDYQATCDQDTLCSLTNHAYFNLAGHNSGSIDDHNIQICADFYTPTDRHSIPTGQVQSVDGTPMDLRVPTRIRDRMDLEFEQLRWAGGYDHNWVLSEEAGALRLAATAVSPNIGIVMKVYTTQPAIQFYSGNYLDGSPNGKGGTRYAKRCGFCLETQGYPDSPHHDNFPSSVLRAGEIYNQRTVYSFDKDESVDQLW